MAFSKRGLRFVDCSIRIATITRFQSHSTNTIRIPTQEGGYCTLPAFLHWRTTTATTLLPCYCSTLFRRFTPHYAELAYAP